MSRRIYDFQCPDGHKAEAFVDSEVRSLPCFQCGLFAERIVSPVRSMLDPISGDFPGATMKWAKNRQETIKRERRTTDPSEG